MRHRDWTTRLHQEIQAASERPFSWGEFDCCTFAAACCIAICDVDPIEKYRGRYSTETGAKRVLKNTHGSLEALWDAYFERVPVAMRQRGDVVLFDKPKGDDPAYTAAAKVVTALDGVVDRLARRADKLIAS